MRELIEEVKLIDKENDIFGTYSKAKAIQTFIELDDNRELLSINNLIAIYGEWGSGKSCLMKTIYNEIDKGKFETLWFDTWKYEKDENLAYSLFKYIGKDRFWDQLKGKGKNILDNVYGIFKSISKGVELNLGTINLKPGEMLDVAEKEDEKIKNSLEEKKCIWEKINEFEAVFKDIGFNEKRLVVFLDDLDRCESENIITLISAIKLLLSINNNIIFVIGIDKKAVTLALQNKYNNDYNKADEYMEKIFPINFELSNFIQTENFLNFISILTDLSNKKSKIISSFFENINFTNARHVKKVLRKYYLIKNYLKDVDIDVNSECVIVVILYAIVLNIFYNDEYRYLISIDKEKNYKDILLVNYDKNGMKKEGNFVVYNKRCNINYKDGGKFEIYQLLIRFSSYRIEKNELNSMKTLEGDAYIKYENWMGMFKNNICSDFIEFLIDNKEILEKFSVDGRFEEENVYNILRKVNDII